MAPRNVQTRPMDSDDEDRHLFGHDDGEPYEIVQQSENDYDEEDDEEVGSDPESYESLPSPGISEYTVKPISPPKSVSKQPATMSGSKRSVDNGSKGESKKKKKLSAVAVVEKEDGAKKRSGEEEEAKKTSGRFWTEEDEVALLKAIQEYKSKYGSVASAHVDAFYDFMRKSMRVEFSKNQLSDKVRRMKKKYLTLAEKAGVENDVSLLKLKPHENKLFHLSAKIWGKNESNEGNDHNSPAVATVPTNSNGSKKKSKSKTNGGKVALISDINNKPITLGLAKVDSKSKKQLSSSSGSKSKSRSNVEEKPLEVEEFAADTQENSVEEENANDDEQVAEEEKEDEVMEDDVIVQEDAVMEEKEDVVAEENGGHNNVDTEKEKEKENENESTEEFWARYPYLNKSLEMGMQSSYGSTSFNRSFLLEKVMKYGKDKAKEMDEKWKKLEEEEMELNIKKLGFIQEHAQLALDAMKKQH